MSEAHNKIKRDWATNAQHATCWLCSPPISFEFGMNEATPSSHNLNSSLEEIGVLLNIKHQLLSDIELRGGLQNFSLQKLCNEKEDI